MVSLVRVLVAGWLRRALAAGMPDLSARRPSTPVWHACPRPRPFAPHGLAADWGISRCGSRLSVGLRHGRGKQPVDEESVRVRVSLPLGVPLHGDERVCRVFCRFYRSVGRAGADYQAMARKVDRLVVQ
jgi:hypothetical protein